MNIANIKKAFRFKLKIKIRLPVFLVKDGSNNILIMKFEVILSVFQK